MRLFTKKVALLDDNDGERELFKEAFHHAGIDFEGFSYPSQFKEFVERLGEFKIVLIDLRLGGHSGLDVVEMIMDNMFRPKIFIVTNEKFERQSKSYSVNYKLDILRDPHKVFQWSEKTSDIKWDVIARKELRHG